jgi:hypothetical protein
MKKNEFPNKDLKIEFIETHNKEVTPERKRKYENEKAKIPTTEGKLNFAEAELAEYVKNAPPEVLHVSGQMNIPGAHHFWAHYLSTDIEYLKQQLNKEKNTRKRKEYSLKEVALAYIFETYATSKNIPKSPQGEYSKTELERIGKDEYNVEKGNSFYCAVRDILNADWDLNKEKHLEHISPRWYDAIKEICINRKSWDAIEKYLKQKGLSKR